MPKIVLTHMTPTIETSGQYCSLHCPQFDRHWRDGGGICNLTGHATIIKCTESGTFIDLHRTDFCLEAEKEENK